MATQGSANEMTWVDFLAHVQTLAPGYEYSKDTQFAELLPYHRVAVVRWLSDVFAQPTALEIIEQHQTLGNAWEWLNSAQASGETLRQDAKPRMRGESSRVRLRAIREHDLPLLYEASFNPQTASRWRYRGRTIPIDEFASSLFDGTLAQYMVEMKETRTPVGMVTAYDENISGLNCKVAFVRCGDRQPGDSGAVFEGVMLLISHIFSHFPYRKIYAEVPAYNMSLLGPGAEEEGVLREYYFHDGEFVDLHFISYSRASWQEMSKNLGW